MLLIDIRSTNASAAEFILYRLKLYLAGRHHHMMIEMEMQIVTTIASAIGSMAGKPWNDLDYSLSQPMECGCHKCFWKSSTDPHNIGYIFPEDLLQGSPLSFERA